MNFSDEESDDSIQHLLTVTPCKSINEEKMIEESIDENFLTCVYLL